MCYYINTQLTDKQWQSQLNVSDIPANIKLEGEISGFEHPKIGILTDVNPGELQAGIWGLLPTDAPPEFLEKNWTLNARMETMEVKPSFRDAANNRCVIPVKGFYEWRWNDAAGRHKTKYFLSFPEDKVMLLGGIFHYWQHPNSFHTYLTFSIVTTEAQGLMKEIHNSKLRMPLIFDHETASQWLSEDVKKEQLPLDVMVNELVCTPPLTLVPKLF